MRVVCLCLCFFLLLACSESAGSSSTGGGSEIIVLFTDSTITGTVKGLDSGYRVSLYEEGYIPEQFTDKNFISKTIEKKFNENEFHFNGLHSGTFSLLVENNDDGSMVFINSVVLSDSSDVTVKEEFTEPITVNGNTDIQSWYDNKIYMLCVGTPFIAEVDTNGVFTFTDIPKGEYTLVAIQDDFTDGPKPDVIPVIVDGTKSGSVTLDSTTMAITVHIKRSMQ